MTSDPLCRVCGKNPVPKHELPQDRAFPPICSSCLREGAVQTVLRRPE